MFNPNVSIDLDDLELTADEIALCDALEAQQQLKRECQATLTEIRNVEAQQAIAAAPSAFEAYWAGSVCASVGRDVAKGRVKKNLCLISPFNPLIGITSWCSAMVIIIGLPMLNTYAM